LPDDESSGPAGSAEEALQTIEPRLLRRESDVVLIDVQHVLCRRGMERSREHVEAVIHAILDARPHPMLGHRTDRGAGLEPTAVAARDQERAARPPAEVGTRQHLVLWQRLVAEAIEARD